MLTTLRRPGWLTVPLVRRTASCAALLPVVLAGLPACDRPAPEPGTTAAISLIDDSGREVALDAPATRIVSLIPSVTDVIVGLGAPDRLVARTRYDEDPRLAGLPSLEDALTPSIEWLVERRPDLVVAWPDRQARTVVTRLSELGIPVYTSSTETLDDMRRGITNIGRLLGLEARADSLVAALDTAIAAVRARVERREIRDVLYLIGLDPPMSAGPGSFIDELITIAGGRNVMGDAPAEWPPVSVEEIVARAPDVVLIAVASADESVVERVRALPGIRRLEAVQGDRVRVLDASLFNRPGPGLIEAVTALARAIHPEAFAQ